MVIHKENEREGFEICSEILEVSHWCLYADLEIELWSVFNWQVCRLDPPADVGIGQSSWDSGKASTSFGSNPVEPEGGSVERR